MAERFVVELPVSGTLADVAGAPAGMIERIVRTIGSPEGSPAFVPALASLPQQTAEPVATVNELPGSNLISWTKPVPPVGTKLYIRPASPPVGGAVTVKPLEWTDDSANGLTTRHALSPIGEYRVGRADDGTWYWALGYGGSPPYVATEDAAKAAAQADYEQRIYAALEPRASDREAVIALEALRDIDNRATVPHADQAVGAFNSDDLRADLRWIADRARAAIRKLSEVSHEH